MTVEQQAVLDYKRVKQYADTTTKMLEVIGDYLYQKFIKTEEYGRTLLINPSDEYSFSLDCTDKVFVSLGIVEIDIMLNTYHAFVTYVFTKEVLIFNYKDFSTALTTLYCEAKQYLDTISEKNDINIKIDRAFYEDNLFYTQLSYDMWGIFNWVDVSLAVNCKFIDRKDMIYFCIPESIYSNSLTLTYPNCVKPKCLAYADNNMKGLYYSLYKNTFNNVALYFEYSYASVLGDCVSFQKWVLYILSELLKNFKRSTVQLGDKLDVFIANTVNKTELLNLELYPLVQELKDYKVFIQLVGEE